MWRSDDANRRSRRRVDGSRGRAIRQARTLEGAVGWARFDLACLPVILEANHVDDLLATHKTVWNAAQLVPAQDPTHVILNAAADEISDWPQDWNSPANRRQETRRALLDRYNDDLVPRLHAWRSDSPKRRGRQAGTRTCCHPNTGDTGITGDHWTAHWVAVSCDADGS